ncbi:hypothetical protein [Aeromicrobium sp. A1-2]|uniref:hypothetical protein n=1 Tax=Aeromicrobium sp. A1-2 TaxID=2107713 RepID=UPI0013C2EB98|nr:hypothetical protein [Aeromicrobium sp. A1-2]
MAKRTSHRGYVSPVPEEELSWRMGSSAGRKLEARLVEQGWSWITEPVDAAIVDA